jgi:hypothetical protein
MEQPSIPDRERLRLGERVASVARFAGKLGFETLAGAVEGAIGAALSVATEKSEIEDYSNLHSSQED